MNDLKFAIRQLLKSPGFTAVAVLTLALGIGANTSMFSALNALLFHKPPYPEPDALIRVFRAGSSFQFAPHSPADFNDYQEQVRSFSHLAAYTGTGFNLAKPGQPAVQLRGMCVSGDFFSVVGVKPALGRPITVDDDRPGNGRVVVLSHACWREQFGAAPSILNHPVRLDGELVTVIGVMPAGFADPMVWGRVDAWRPLAYDNRTMANRGGHWLSVFGRLADSASVEQAQAEMNAVAENLARAYPDTNAESGVHLVSLVRSAQEDTTRLLTWFAMGLAVCVLLIACANLANLLFARNALRLREHGIRIALGASRLRLIRQVLTECFVLSFAGGALGLLVAIWCNEALGSRLSIAGLPGFALPVDWQVLGFASALAMFSALAFGLLPALLASRADVATSLKQGGHGHSGSHHRLRRALIAIEVALACVLLSSAGFLVRGLERFIAANHGWRTDHLLTARVSLPGARYGGDDAMVAFYNRLESSLAVLPGVQSVTLSRTLPFQGFQWGQPFIVEGRPAPTPGTEPMRDVNGVSMGYFETLGLTLVEGRTFVPADLHGPVRTVIGESMARQLWPGESAVGKRIARPGTKAWQEVIGVVRDVGFASNLENPGRRPQTYRLLAREPDLDIAISMRCLVAPSSLADPLRRAVMEIDPELPVRDILPAARVVERDLSNHRLMGWLLSGFALLGLLLAAFGIYGVISGFVTRRAAEIGIRMALGAQVRHVLHLVIGQGLRLVVVGMALGLAGAWAAARLLASMMPAFPSPEPVVTVCVSLALVAVALVASWLPARRAAKADPMEALRTE